MGYILITGFKENTCEQFMTAMETLREQGMRALVLDLRYNPGGSVNTVYIIFLYRNMQAGAVRQEEQPLYQSFAKCLRTNQRTNRRVSQYGLPDRG